MFGCQVDVVCRILLLLDEMVTLPCKIFSSNALFLFLRSFFIKNNFENKYGDIFWFFSLYVLKIELSQRNLENILSCIQRMLIYESRVEMRKTLSKPSKSISALVKGKKRKHQRNNKFGSMGK